MIRERVSRITGSAIMAAAAWLTLGGFGAHQLVRGGGVGWLWLALLLGALAGARGLERVVAAASASALGLLLAVQWIPLFGGLARRYVREDTLPEQAVDGVVVLSAGLSADGRLNTPGVDRLLEGLRLVRAGRSSRLILSRVASSVDGDSVRSDEDQQELVATAGLAPELHIVHPVGSTRLEAVRIRELADRHAWRTLIVVTSPTHTHRACATFEAVGFRVICRPSPDRSVALSSQKSPMDRSLAFGQWVYETLGWWKYRWRGWVRTGSREQ